MSVRLLLAALSCLAISCPAAVPSAHAETAAGPLTPTGALVAGDDRHVPAWEGGISEPPEAYGGPGTMHPDPFAGDEPAAVLRAGQLGAYAELVPAGLLRLLEAYPETATLPVYPTRRSHAAPAWVYENTARDRGAARLVDGGNGFSGARAAIPFPEPAEAIEVYWNHVARWRGLALENRALDIVVRADGRVARSTRETLVRFDYYLAEGAENRLFSLLSRVTAPPQRAGGGVLVLETINQDAERRSAWSWDTSRRRALRAPQLEFDQVVANTDGLLTADAVDLANGSPSRFEWRLLGRRALVVPYNSYALAAADRDSLLLPGHLDPASLRYEVHRVWVIEGRLRPAWRHAYPRRVLYVDEDSWTALVSESYDATDALARVGVAYTKNYYEIPGTLPVAYVFHDLPSRRYVVQGLGPDPTRAPKHLDDVPGNGRFTPTGLRRFVR